MNFISVSVASVFFLLSCLHFFWAMGGQWGFAEALPTTIAGKRVLNPQTFDCVVVGMGLLAFGLLVLAKGDILPISLPTWLKNNGLWFVAIIFFLRAVGDFRYVGFFKSITTTDFAKLDTFYYSPLCLILALALCILQMK